MKIDREWSMPNSNTFSIKPIKELILKYIEKLPKNYCIVDPFANTNKYGTITNDLNEEYDTDYHLDATDFLKLLKDNSCDMVLYDPPYCYDDKTELLTSNGFKNIMQITITDKLATLNTKTNLLEYQNPTEVIKKSYQGDMYKIQSQSINLFVTPNHRCFVKNSLNGEYKWVLAKDLFKETSRHWFKKACDYEGQEEEFFILPEITLNKANRFGEKIKNNKKIPMDIWLKFFGLYITEGSYNANLIKRSKNGRCKYRYVISITQKKPDLRKEIKNVLDELGFNYCIEGNDFIISDKQLWTYFKQFGYAKDKFIPQELKNLSKRQLNLLIDYMMLGDGTYKTCNKLNKTKEYSTASLRLHNDFCEIAIKAGFAISTRVRKKGEKYIWYNTHILKAKDFSVKKENLSIEQYIGFVYCVSVPNTTLLVRRNGKVFWCGNSPRQVSECYKQLGKTVNMTTTQASYWSKQKEQIGRIVKENGYVITFGWNSGGIGKKYGFEIQEILLVAHGGWHNDTICTVEQKIY